MIAIRLAKAIALRSARDQIRMSKALRVIEDRDDDWRHSEYLDLMVGIGSGRLTWSGYFCGSICKTLLASDLSETGCASAAIDKPVISITCGVS